MTFAFALVLSLYCLRDHPPAVISSTAVTACELRRDGIAGRRAERRRRVR